MADDYSADDTADLLGLQSLKSETDLSGWDSKSGDGGLLDAFEKSTANAADTIRKQMRKLSFDGGLRPKLGAEDNVTKSNVPSLSEAKKEAAATTAHQHRQATAAQAKISPWQVKRKSSRGTRKQEKMYQGRMTSQPKNNNDQLKIIERKNSTNNNTTPQLERKNSAPQEFRSSKYDASPPWTVKPKVQVSGKSRQEMFDAASVWAQQQKEHAEQHRKMERRYSKSNIEATSSSSPPMGINEETGKGTRSKFIQQQHRPKRLSQSNIEASVPSSRRERNQRQFQRRRSRSLGSASTESLDDIGTPSLPFSGGGEIAERRRSLSLDASDTRLGQRPSLKKRPVLSRRLSNQNELSSRSLIAGSIQQEQGRRSSFTTIEHVPLKDNEKKDASDRGRSRKGERPGPRRRSRSLGSASSGELLHDLIPVPKLPLSEHTRPRRRSLSWDSGPEQGVTTTDFKAIREDLEKRRASRKPELEEKEDATKKKSRTHDVDERKRQSMPAVRQAKKVDDSRKRHSMPANKARKGKSEEDSRKIEAFSDALKSGEASGRRTSRRAKASERVARLQSSLTNSMKKKRKSSSAHTASGATAAAATVASGETSEEADQLLERHASTGSSERRSGFHISVFMMAVMCFCYLISLVGMCALGFFLHMEFFAYKDTGTTMKSNVDVNPGMYDNPGETVSGTGPMLRPSLRPSGPTSGVNIQPIPTDGGLSTKLSPATPAPSISPTETHSRNPSSIPTPISSDIPSFSPTSSSSPSANPSISGMPSESPSLEPTLVPSTSPSASPTTLDECPETLTKSMPFISDTSLTLYYETVIYPSHPTGGLFCASLEYVGTAGWIGIAFSTAGRNPQFGRREAIIGMPGVDSSEAVSLANTTSQALNPSGSQSNFVDGPYFVNPGKYVIPAGGLEGGYYGPSLDLLMPGFQQTLVNASVTTSLNESNQTITRLSFAKYLREWGEITIDPLSGPTLLLYAVAPVDENGTYVNDNPEWRYINLILQTWSKRKRQHSDNTHR